MIHADSFFGRNALLGNEAQHFDECQLMLCVVDFASEQRNASAIFLGIMDQLESVISGASATAENAHHQIRIVLRQFLHRARAVINNFQEHWPA